MASGKRRDLYSSGGDSLMEGDDVMGKDMNFTKTHKVKKELMR